MQEAPKVTYSEIVNVRGISNPAPLFVRPFGLRRAMSFLAHAAAITFDLGKPTGHGTRSLRNPWEKRSQQKKRRIARRRGLVS